MTDIGQRLVAHAALSGPFQPARFRYRTPAERRRGLEVGKDDWSAALARLAPLCEEVEEGGNHKWVMRTADRGQVLAGLARQGPGAIERIYRLRPPRKDDVFARTLRACLRPGPPPDAAAVPAGGLRDAISAAIFAGAIVDGEERKRQVKELERALYQRAVAKAADARHSAVLPRPLVGRVAERAALLAFLQAGAVAPPLEALGNAATPPANVLLIGSPGVGKSAFLADMVTSLGASLPAAFVVNFDFDQLTLTRGSVVAWAEELTRQIGDQAPEVEPDLSRIRGEHARRRAEYARSPSEGAASGESDAVALIHEAWASLGGLPPRPLVLVADTIEEITARDSVESFADAPENTLFHQFITWVAFLREKSVGPRGPVGMVCLVAAGRAAPPVDDAALARWFGARLELRELEDEAARELLSSRDRGLSEDIRWRIVAAVGGHPLHLVMVQQQCARLHSRGRERFVGDLEREGLRGALPDDATRTLYSRFLDRLRIRRLPPGLAAGEVRKLARGAIVLREVTAPLLAEVVAPALGVELGDNAAAALGALRDQAWLVLPSGRDGPVRHRPDVRRVMLPMLLDDREPADRGLLDAAVAWYEGHSAQPGARQEAAYLRALRGSADDIGFFIAEPSLAASALSLAGSDLAVIPLASRAILKVLGRPGEPLSEAEIAALPEPQRSGVRLRQESAAMKAFGGMTRPAPQGAPERRSRAEFDWSGLSTDAYEVLLSPVLHDAVEVAFLRADFASVAELGWIAMHHIRRWPDLLYPLGLITAFEQSWLWRSTLALALHPPEFGPESPLVEAILLAEQRIAAGTAPDIGPDAFGAAIFDLLPLLDIVGPQEERPIRPPWAKVPNLRDFRQMRLAGATARLRKALAQAGTVRFAFLPAALPIFGAALAGEACEFVGTKGPEIDLKILALRDVGQESGSLADDVYDRIGELSVEDREGWSLVVHPRGPGGAAALAAVMRGSTPELRDPVVTCLAGIPPDFLAAAADRVAPAVQVWPSQLSVGLGRTLGGRSKVAALRQLVQWLELCGLLRPFLDELSQTGGPRELADLRALLAELDRRWVLQPAG